HRVELKNRIHAVLIPSRDTISSPPLDRSERRRVGRMGVAGSGHGRRRSAGKVAHGLEPPGVAVDCLGTGGPQRRRGTRPWVGGGGFELAGGFGFVVPAAFEEGGPAG